MLRTGGGHLSLRLVSLGKVRFNLIRLDYVRFL